MVKSSFAKHWELSGGVLFLLPAYLWWRLVQAGRLFIATLEIFVGLTERLKYQTVSRMFWGRGGLYKNLFHLSITLLTLGTLLTGIATQLSVYSTSQVGLQVNYGQGASDDLLQQGASIRTVLPVDPNAPEIKIRIHVVAVGETLEQIAAAYGVSIDTVRWANSKLVSPFSNAVEAGWQLKIPEIDGVLHTVRVGQTLEDIAQITGGNIIDIIEINELVPPDYPLTPGQEVFVPSGTLPESEVVIAGIPQGVFDNPLSHPACAGYTFSRGFTAYHNGVDLARFPGCPIRAIAAGRVIYAGWSSAAGFNVRIDHGGGITTHYYHGTGEFWVKVGDRVQQGQDIMMMGTSGNSTGVHLHLSLFKDKYAVNPAYFVPY